MTTILFDNGMFCDIEVSVEFVELLQALRIFTRYDGHPGLQPGECVYLNPHSPIRPYVGLYASTHLPTIGSFSYSFSAFDRMVSIGAYCSISWNVQVMGIDHPMNTFSTSAALYEGHGIFEAAFEDAGIAGQYRANPQKAPPVVGNDVWIGQDVLLGRGITIGDGAVVAAGAVVVKDVPPYAIVAGCPARLIRYRFTEAERDALQTSRWWEFAMPDLTARPADDIAAFLASLQDAVDTKAIRRIRTFDVSLADLCRAGTVASFTAALPGLFVPPDV